MTENRNSNSPVYRFLSQRSLLAGGLSCLSGISILSAGIVLAQTSTSDGTVDSPVNSTVPNAEDLLSPTLQDSSTPSTIPPSDASFDPSQPPASAEQPTVIPPDLASPGLESSTPESSTSSFPQLPGEASPLTTEVIPSIETPTTPSSLVSPNLVEDVPSAFGNPATTQGSDVYIDSTPYDIGATKPNIILSERSTGCQAVLQPGQEVPNSICPPPIATATGAGSFDGTIPEPGSLGGLSVFSFESGGTSVSGRDFYNLTVRPPAQLSNGNLSLLFPLSIPAAITSVFGWRLHPIMGDMRFHSGTDIGAPQGTPVLAAFDGKVQIADLVGGYGLAVVLEHSKNTEQTLYAHLSEVFVQPGDEVKQGEVIGRVGSTGLSTGPHLHFEFRKLTQEGWVVMDAGAALEFSLAQFIQNIQAGYTKPLPYPAIFAHSGKYLQMPAQTTATTETPPTKPLFLPQPSPDAELRTED
ncbi:MAG: M23 family metallopeptidase [Cyanobacteria bacterium CRU_2_1]|nr:M23 family metallopeptidase [Cyanobacteria bacterium RU_5_0]NJR57675.1 M23 family metallopeptidase [Cyanobacteria bacterium CRU_2_1]